MITGYYQHCTFFAVFRDSRNTIYSATAYIDQALDSPRAFYDWVEYRRRQIADHAENPVIIVEMKCVAPVITNFYNEIEN